MGRNSHTKTHILKYSDSVQLARSNEKIIFHLFFHIRQAKEFNFKDFIAESLVFDQFSMRFLRETKP